MYNKINRTHFITCKRNFGVRLISCRGVDEMFRKAQAGGVVVGREKVWSLAFADDMVIVAKSEREMKEMMKNLGKYVRKKKLEVNVEKTKMMVFNNRKRKSEGASGSGKKAR
jgi:hypothetical protein